MKKLLTLALAALLCFSLVACGGDDAKETNAGTADGTADATADATEDATADVTEDATEDATEGSQNDVATRQPIPDGYSEYAYGTLKFAAPSDWQQYEEQLYSADYMAHITMTNEPYTDKYASMTAESFDQTMRNELADQAITVIGEPAIEHGTNQNGIEVTIISMQAYLGDPEAYLVYFVVADGDTNYVLVLEDSHEELDAETYITIADSFYIG